MRILNVSTDYSSLDMYINDGSSSNDTSTCNRRLRGRHDYTSFKPGTYSIKFKVHSASTPPEPERSEAG